MKKIICIIQARMLSTRLPGKIIKNILYKSSVERVIERVKISKLIDSIWLATTNHPSDNILLKYATLNAVKIFRGSVNDVLSRYVKIANIEKADVIVRITADCPLIDSEIIDKVIRTFLNKECDYTSNTITRSYPDGLDVEVFSAKALYKADKEAKHPLLREHVTPYITGTMKNFINAGKFKKEQVIYPKNYSYYRWTLDEKEDLVFLRRVFKYISDFSGWLEVIKLIEKKPNLIQINNNIKTNEGTNIGLKKFNFL